MGHLKTATAKKPEEARKVMGLAKPPDPLSASAPVDPLIKTADSDADRKQGLKGERLQADEGMLFRYDNEGDRSFTMQDTPEALDIAFADRDGKIASVDTMQPGEKQGAKGTGQYALELKQGSLARQGVKEGDDLSAVKGLQGKS